MKFETLKSIEKLLRDDVKQKEKKVELLDKKLKGLYQNEADNPEYFDIKNLKFWQESKKRNVDNLIKAREALDDFLNHEFH